MGFTYVTKNNASNEANATGGFTVGATGVQAGDAIALWLKYEGGAAVAATVGDGVSTFNALTARTFAGPSQTGQWHYLLSSVATGAVSYSITLATAREFRRAHVFVYRPTGTVTLQSGSDVGATGNSAAPSSGNLSLTGSGEWLAFGGYAEFNYLTNSNHLINGVAADQVEQASNPPGNSQASFAWAKTFAAPFTNGAAQATLSGGSEWVCGAFALNDDGGGGPIIVPRREPLVTRQAIIRAASW